MPSIARSQENETIGSQEGAVEEAIGASDIVLLEQLLACAPAQQRARLFDHALLHAAHSCSMPSFERVVAVAQRLGVRLDVLPALLWTAENCREVVDEEADGDGDEEADDLPVPTAADLEACVRVCMTAREDNTDLIHGLLLLAECDVSACRRVVVAVLARVGLLADEQPSESLGE